MSYKDLKFEDLEITSYPDYISWEELEKKMGIRGYNKFCKWFGGQTCVGEGAYPDDVKRYLNLNK